MKNRTRNAIKWSIEGHRRQDRRGAAAYEPVVYPATA